MEDRQFKTVPFAFKAATGDGSTGEGLASVFFNIDSYGEIVDNKAFDQDIPTFLEEGFVGGINHEWDCPIGSPTSAKATDVGLEVGWKISDTSHGRDVMVLLKDKVIKKLSIGYRVLGDMILETYDDVVAYWAEKKYKPNSQDVARAQNGYIRVLTRLKLFEFSPVTVPANNLAYITAVKAAAIEAAKGVKRPDEIDEDDNQPNPVRAFEKHLRDELGFSASEAKRAIAAAKALPRDVASDDDKPDEPVTPDEPKADETPAEDKSDDAPAPDNADITPEPAEDAPIDPLGEAKAAAKARTARTLSQAAAEIDAKIATLLAKAGANPND